jgi:hypothetical protein
MPADRAGSFWRRVDRALYEEQKEGNRMQLPPDVERYMETRPPADLAPETVVAFERLYREAVEHGSGAEIPYDLVAPKWQFLCYLTDNKGVLVHGSTTTDIEEFEPRQSDDVGEFGNRKAVYAAADALWSMYFAIADRRRGVTSLNNACFRVVNEDGSKSQPYYFFSINGDALPDQPWCNGTIYILPRAGFEQQPPVTLRGITRDIPQWASPEPVRPLARLNVTPADFPFLGRIRGHDHARLRERIMADPEGFPWVDE